MLQKHGAVSWFLLFDFCGRVGRGKFCGRVGRGNFCPNFFPVKTLAASLFLIHQIYPVQQYSSNNAELLKSFNGTVLEHE